MKLQTKHLSMIGWHNSSINLEGEFAHEIHGITNAKLLLISHTDSYFGLQTKETICPFSRMTIKGRSLVEYPVFVHAERSQLMAKLRAGQRRHHDGLPIPALLQMRIYFSLFIFLVLLLKLWTIPTGINVHKCLCVKRIGGRSVKTGCFLFSPSLVVH